jgi:hypothetical protein
MSVTKHIATSLIGLFCISAGWNRNSVKSAAKGDFNEHKIQIPR